jgi:hypothetical protein
MDNTRIQLLSATTADLAQPMRWRLGSAGPRYWALVPLPWWCTQDPLPLALVGWTLSGWLTDAPRRKVCWMRLAS